MPILSRRGFIAGAMLATMSAGAQANAQETPVIAAAASLKFAIEEIARDFRKNTGLEVRLSFGASGNFVRQILQGAPYQMFMAADEESIRRVAAQGKSRDEGVVYAVGRIVIFAATDSPLKADASLDDLRAALADGRVKRFAIANPEHAPYGRAAEQALRAQGLWEAMQSRLVLGENVSQAAQFASGGTAQGGIFAYSLAVSPAVAERGTYALLPADWYRPLRQRMVLMKSAGETAQRFFAYVQTPGARAVFDRYGFAHPGNRG